MAITWIEHNNKKILYVNYEGLKSEKEMIDLLHEEIEIEKKSNIKIPVLANFNDTFLSQEYVAEAKKLGKEVRNEKTLKTALLGITGVKKILLKAYNMFTGDKNTKVFENQEEAKDWLTE